MFNSESYEKMNAMLTEGLIDRKTFEIVNRSKNSDVARTVILKIIARQTAVLRQEEENSPSLVKIVAGVNRMRKAAGLHALIEIEKLLVIWESLLRESVYPGEESVNIVLCKKSYMMIMEFFDSHVEECFFTVRPKIKNIFIPASEADKIPNSIMQHLCSIPEVKVIYDSGDFVAQSRDTMVIFEDFSFKDEEAFGLLRSLLAEGIFAIINENMKVSLEQLIGVRQAIEKSSLEDGKGAIYLNGEVCTKPFNPDTATGRGVSFPEGEFMSDGNNLLGDAIKKAFISGGLMNIG